MNASYSTPDGTALEDLVRCEHLSIPPTVWGYFLPVTVACWRFLHLHAPELVPDVHVQKWDLIGAIPSRLTIEGSHYLMERFPAGLPQLPEDPASPLFLGDRTRPFLDLICSDGPVLDLVEAISWQYLKSFSREQIRSGVVKEGDLPRIERSSYDRLALLLLSGIRAGEPQHSS